MTWARETYSDSKYTELKFGRLEGFLNTIIMPEENCDSNSV